MLISLNWLQDYVDLSGLSAKDIAATLTDIGLEIEGITCKSSFSDDVVVGKVLTAVQHPNADSLRLCTVDAGEAEPLAIVCGAPNARADIYVAVAKIGATLPGDFKIKKTKIRGETSCGMLCSGQELGLNDDHDGIMELPGTHKIGSSVGHALGLSDTLLTVNVTPNRGDCLGYLGIARDLAARLGRPLRLPAANPLASPNTSSASQIKVSIENADICGRFVALYVDHVPPLKSPAWLTRRLEANDMRPINTIVDVTNYVMLECGQPIHAYDVRDIAGGEIIVRAARDGEVLKTLDSQERKLVAGDILICDQKGPIGLAGVMGGANSEVKGDTKAIVIEVASFNPTQIRQTAKRLALHTEASHRFERGTDTYNLEFVARRAAALLQSVHTELKKQNPEIAIPAVASDLVNNQPQVLRQRMVALRLPKIREFFALPNLAASEIESLLKGLGIERLDGNEERLVFSIPGWRNDIEREVDLFEEVGRMKGYDKIYTQLPNMNIRPSPEDALIDFTDQMRYATANAGFNETISLPFVSAQQASSLLLSAAHPLFPKVTLANPLSTDFALLHTSLLPGLLTAIAEGRKQGDQGMRLFECGRGYFRFSGDAVAGRYWQGLNRPGRHLTKRAKDDAGRIIERHYLAAVIDQPWTPASWQGPAVAASFYHGKNVLQTLLNNAGVKQVQLQKIEAAELPFLHPGAAIALFVQGKYAGYAGELHPQVAQNFDIGGKQSPIVIELDLEILLSARNAKQQFEPILQRFPPVSRDLAFLVDASLTYQELADAVKGFKRKQFLQRFDLFDVYTGANLPAGKKSLALTFYFQSEEKTLSDKDVENEITGLVTWLGEKVGAAHR